MAKGKKFGLTAIVFLLIIIVQNMDVGSSISLASPLPESKRK